MTTMTNERFDRNIRFFGKEGQERLWASHVAVVGIGGLGTHVVQQLALLGVGHLTLIDKEELDKTNTNRYVGTRHDDPIPGTPKVDIGERIAKAINPDIRVNRIPVSLVSKEAFEAIIPADYVFGCLDQDGLRLILNEVCSAYSRPYFDLASEILPGDPPTYGGRVCVAWDGQGCIVCYDQLDVREAQLDLISPEAKRNQEAIYGIERQDLGQVGPSVVSINGVVASLAVTEFILGVTGIRPPKRLLTYYGNMGCVPLKTEEPAPNCYYCKGIRGQGEAVDIWRYIREGVKL
jgi:molybdopterin/thiamine biosynthesis adenylyltransferase